MIVVDRPYGSTISMAVTPRRPMRWTPGSGRKSSLSVTLRLVLQGFPRDADVRQALTLLESIEFREMLGKRVAIESARNYRMLRKRKVSLQFNIENLLDKDYFYSSTGGREFGGAHFGAADVLGIGAGGVLVSHGCRVR